jgi:hypothetical protein
MREALGLNASNTRKKKTNPKPKEYIKYNTLLFKDVFAFLVKLVIILNCNLV